MLSVSHIKPPEEGRNNYRVVISLPGHGKQFVGGYPKLTATKRFQTKLDVLIDAQQQGNPVPASLIGWIRKMPKRQAKTLERLGVIDARLRHVAQPIDKHIRDFEPVVRQREANDDGYTPRPWYTHDIRRMVYWTAMKTGFRKGELASLPRHRFHLKEKRPYIEIPGREAKNKQLAGVPIPVELAAALREHTKMMAPSTKVFRIPRGQGAKDWLHRGLKGAKLGHVLDTDQHDFHSLRATAIVWWLEIDGFSQLVVKELARFKALAMVQKYVRGFRATPGTFDQLDKAPSMARKIKETLSDG